MQASTSDPKANSLLDFISIRESEGNYNAYISHAGSTDDLSVKTISDIYDFQRQLINQGEPSSAVGRYQFVQRTLNGLVVQLGIPLQSPFTPKLQDQLAMSLLNARGYQNWLKGAITDEQFAHNLSCEWASLPDPFNGGKSHYDGVGPNHAGQTLATVFAILATTKASPLQS